MNKIFFLVTNSFDPDLRAYKQAKYLAAKGFTIEVLSWDRDGRYRERPIEELTGIKIKRFFPKAKYGTGLKQLAPYLRFIKECKVYLSKHASTDCYYHCADLDGMLAGYLAAPKRSKLVFDMREFYESGNLSKLRYAIRFFVRILQDRAYRIIYLNDLQKKYVRKRNLKKLVYLPNYPEKEKFINTEKAPSDRLRISFIGYVRHHRQLEALVKAAAAYPAVEVAIHGGGVDYPRMKEFCHSYPQSKVTGMFKHENIGGLYNQTDMLYLVYDVKDLNDRHAYPTKFFEAIITGTPMIVARHTVIGDFCEAEEVGFTVGKDLEKDISEIIEEILENPNKLEKMRYNICKMSKAYSWEGVVPNLDQIYQ